MSPSFLLRMPELTAQRLLVAVSDSASGQVIWRQFDGNAVASHYLDPVPAKFAGHARQNRFASVEFDGKHSSPEFFDNFAHHFDTVFFCQMFSPVLRVYVDYGVYLPAA